MKIVVIGGTGLIGSRLVSKLTEHGHEAIPASPRLGINTITGEGLAAALDGASVVVDVSNSPNFEYATALEFFERSTHNLLAAERRQGRPPRRALGGRHAGAVPERRSARRPPPATSWRSRPRRSSSRPPGSRTRSSTRPSSSSSSRASPTRQRWARRSACRRSCSSPWLPTTSPRGRRGSRRTRP